MESGGPDSTSSKSRRTPLPFARAQLTQLVRMSTVSDQRLPLHSTQLFSTFLIDRIKQSPKLRLGNSPDESEKHQTS
ncbi:hypothetical protein T265_04935 [Opisthorchis viverrini]|uniref:Uncharacterized protein n=1 Tax=Opisthorchis viverrini TaxID=6198 RepID=A0A074ZQV2_OPIVI|nr:hypothetical protein T265_04935 [Opisthorchis viverrini]KER28177.1 hypothetical protein T265_04935 [Opisthorchis viverrini]